MSSSDFISVKNGLKFLICASNSALLPSKSSVTDDLSVTDDCLCGETHFCVRVFIKKLILIF